MSLSFFKFTILNSIDAEKIDCARIECTIINNNRYFTELQIATDKQQMHSTPALPLLENSIDLAKSPPENLIELPKQSAVNEIEQPAIVNNPTGLADKADIAAVMVKLEIIGNNFYCVTLNLSVILRYVIISREKSRSSQLEK